MRAETDRERVLRLEAENAQLREELAAWRAYERDDADDDAALEREALLGRRLQDLGLMHAGRRQIARLLLYLLERPGRLVTGRQIKARLCGARAEEVRDTYPKVIISLTRTTLDLIGHRAAIITVWGSGWILDPDAAPAIRKALGLAE